LLILAVFWTIAELCSLFFRSVRSLTSNTGAARARQRWH
jgi:hypothetical protein